MNTLRDKLKALVEQYNPGIERLPFQLNLYISKEIVETQIKRLEALELNQQNRNKSLLAVSVLVPIQSIHNYFSPTTKFSQE